MKDFLIIGQGIAGSILAYKLMRCGYSVLVVDDNHKSAASIAATGLIQPLSGKYLSLADINNQFIDCAIDFYKEIDQFLNISSFSKLKSYKILNDKQISIIEKKKKKQKFLDYISSHYLSVPHLQNKQTCIELKKTYRVIPKIILAAFKDYYISEKSYLEKSFDLNECKFNQNHVSFKGMKAKTIILCNGFKISTLPFFKDINFEHVKGESLCIKSKERPFNYITQSSCWAAPLDSGYHIGSTYSKELNLHPTRAARDTFNIFLDTINIEIDKTISHQVGIRCVTQSRKPLIQQSKICKKVWAFTGFGSKGFMTIPYYANALIKRITYKDDSFNLEN